MNLVMLLSVSIVTMVLQTNGSAAAKEELVLDHKATLSDGTMVQLDEQYAGKVVLVVNTASRCGFTRQYEGLQTLYETHKEAGFVVLAFPCNDFGGQEPKAIDEIVEFCSSTFGVTFPVFDKVRVLGEEAHPLFLDLRSQPEPIGGEPKWNFTKYLINRDGTVAARFGPRVEPDGAELTGALEAALAEAIPEQGG
ncbi:MAG: glutathione peroxidase [Planctomycetota bacterium]